MTRHLFPRDPSLAWKQNRRISGCWGLGAGRHPIRAGLWDRHPEPASRVGPGIPLVSSSQQPAFLHLHTGLCVSLRGHSPVGSPSLCLWAPPSHRAQLSRSRGLKPRLPDCSAWCLQRLGLCQRGLRPLCKHRCLTSPWQGWFCHQFFMNEKSVFIKMK